MCDCNSVMAMNDLLTEKSPMHLCTCGNELTVSISMVQSSKHSRCTVVY